MSLRFACVEARLSAAGETEIASALMFHGAARRPGAAYPRLHYALGAKLEYPLRLTRNVHRLPAIFRPMLNWVVAEEVAEILRQFPNIELLRAEPEKLFDEPYEVGEERWDEVMDDDDFFDAFPAEGGLAARLGNYFEVIVADYAQLQDRIAKSGPIVELPTEYSSDPERIQLDRQLLEEYPMFRAGSLAVLQGSLYSRIEPFLDRRFFRCAEVETAE